MHRSMPKAIYWGVPAETFAASRNMVSASEQLVVILPVHAVMLFGLFVYFQTTGAPLWRLLLQPWFARSQPTDKHHSLRSLALPL